MEITTEYIIEFLEGRLSPSEEKELEDLQQSSDEIKKEIDDIRFIWETAGKLKLHRQIDTSRNWKKVSRQIALDKYKRQIWNLTRSAAAILLLPTLIATVTLFVTLKEWNNRPVEEVKLTSAQGLISKITLSDGSEVWLNSGSSLSYPKHFTNNKRVVKLSGEAYFKVKSDKSHRFDVTTSNNIIVSAYGTEFNVSAYHDDEKIEATLANGSLDVSQTGQPISRTLRPEEFVAFDKKDNTMNVSQVNIAVKTAWKDGKIIFRRANMQEIIKKLSRHFNVSIVLEGKELYSYEYSATFTTETLAEILQLLEKTAPIKCQIIEPEQDEEFAFSKRTVIIRSR